jgi:hypothetical protein
MMKDRQKTGERAGGTILERSAKVMMFLIENDPFFFIFDHLDQLRARFSPRESRVSISALAHWKERLLLLRMMLSSLLQLAGCGRKLSGKVVTS